MEKLVAYIDESGGHGFDFSKQGTSTHFVVSAIIVDADKVAEVSEAFMSVKNTIQPQGELKSKSIGGKDDRRRKALAAFNALHFKFYYLVVDKRLIHLTSGLQYKESFYKFLYGILYNSLYRNFSYLDVVADELISSEFVDGFKAYIVENHQPDLFHTNTITFSKSHETGLLQLADLVGGSLRRFYSGQSDLNPHQVLIGKNIGRITWPNEHGNYTVDEETIKEEFSKEISDVALLRINDYISKNQSDKDTTIKLRVLFLSYLRSVFLYNSRSRYVFSQEFIRHLSQVTGEIIKEQYLRQQIVGPLRSEGILIVSDKAGYKIPSTIKDVIMFFNLFSKIIHPMVSRLEKTHEALYTVTQGKLNLLEYPEFEFLNRLMRK